MLSPQLPYPPNWGFATRVYQIVRHLGERHEVTLLAFASDRDELAKRELAKHCRAVHTVEASFAWGPARRRRQIASLLSPRSFQLQRYAAPAMQAFIDDLLARELFDVIQVESSHLGQFQFHSDAVLVLDEHNIEYELLGRVARTEQEPLRKLFNAVEHIKVRSEEEALWRRFGACVTTSEREERIVLASVPRSATATVPNGVDVDYFRPLEVEAQPETIVFTGQLDYRPNIDALAFMSSEVLPLVRRRRPAARLVVVGSFDNQEVPRLGGPGVTLTGGVPDVRPYLAGAAVVVAPLRMGSGTRLKVLEALAMARPMVSTAVGSEGLDVVDGEHLMLADDAASFAQRVVELLENPAAGNALGDRGRALVRSRYDWRIVVDRLEELHADLVDGTRPDGA